MKKINATKPTQLIQALLPVPVEVKMTIGKRVVGTVKLTEIGLSFRKANAKNNSGSIGWAALAHLLSVGLWKELS
jgi:hypothetical protein